MRYLLYFLLGPWYGQWAVFSLMMGLWFLLSQRLVQPIHGFKLRKIVGVCFLVSTLTSFAWTLHLGRAPMSAQHRQELYQLEKNIPNGGAILENNTIEDLTEMDFFLLKRKMKRATHPHFRRHVP